MTHPTPASSTPASAERTTQPNRPQKKSSNHSQKYRSLETSSPEQLKTAYPFP